jgi:hypothetical protein
MLQYEIKEFIFLPLLSPKWFIDVKNRKLEVELEEKQNNNPKIKKYVIYRIKYFVTKLKSKFYQ